MTDAELLSAYRDTTWTVRMEGVPVEIRLDHAPRLPAPWTPAGIITAYNPASEERSEAANVAAQGRLESELRQSSARLAPCIAGGTGADADRWTEPGFLVSGMERAALVRLAERFGQNAIVWIDSAGAPTLVNTRRGFCGAAPGDLI